MSTIHIFFLLLTPSESFEESIARESADPEAVETLSLNGVLFPASEYESVGIDHFRFQILVFRGQGRLWRLVSNRRQPVHTS